MLCLDSDVIINSLIIYKKEIEDMWYILPESSLHVWARCYRINTTCTYDGQSQ